MTREISLNNQPTKMYKLNNKVTLTLTTFIAVAGLSLCAYTFYTQEKRGEEFLKQKNEIMNLKDINLAEKYIKILNMPNFNAVRFSEDYRKKLINEVLDLGYNVIMTKGSNEDKITFILGK